MAPLEAVCFLASFPLRPNTWTLSLQTHFMLLRQSLLQFRVFTRWLSSDILPSPVLSQATYFGSSTSDAEMDFSRSLAGHGLRYIVKG